MTLGSAKMLHGYSLMRVYWEALSGQERKFLEIECLVFYLLKKLVVYGSFCKRSILCLNSFFPQAVEAITSAR